MESWGRGDITGSALGSGRERFLYLSSYEAHRLIAHASGDVRRVNRRTSTGVDEKNWPTSSTGTVAITYRMSTIHFQRLPCYPGISVCSCLVRLISVLLESWEI